MTHREQIVKAFKNNHWRMQLAHILCYPWGYEWRARASELRREGYIIVFQKGKKPSENTYVMTPPDKNGQIRFA